MKIPESISEIYYLLGKYGWVFQLVLACIGFCLLPTWLSVSEENCQWMCFLSCGGLLFISAAPCLHKPLERTVHYVSAVVCCLSAVLWQLYMDLWDVTLWFAFVGLMLTIQNKNNWCWWLEWATIGSLLANIYRLI